jgi:hypothetical protein
VGIRVTFSVPVKGVTTASLTLAGVDATSATGDPGSVDPLDGTQFKIWSFKFDPAPGGGNPKAVVLKKDGIYNEDPEDTEAVDGGKPKRKNTMTADVTWNITVNP